MSIVTSEEIFLLHATAFSCFCGTSISSMILVIFVIRDKRNARLKMTLLKLSLLCVAGAVYAYYRHSHICENYVYSIFALCEYTVVAANMVWHSYIVQQFTGYDLAATPRLEIK